MTKIAIPTSPDGFREFLGDKAKVAALLSQEASANGETKLFWDAYAKEYLNRNGDTTEDLRTQMQSVMFDMIRDNGGGRQDVGKLLGFQNGRPQVQLSEGASLSRGHGALYNKAAPGAQMEDKLPLSDRFGSIGEYLAAIKEEARPTNRPNRGEMVAKLDKLRQFQASFAEDDPGAGGFLVTEEMRADLLQLALEDSIVRANATVIPMSTLRVPIPIVDETSHVSDLFGGVKFYWAEESASLTESQGKFGRIQLEARKLTGFFKVPNELLADAPAFSGWFDSRIPAGLAWYEDVAFMTGDGAEKPQGFIGSPGYINVDRAVINEIAYTDIVTMYSRMLPTSLKSAIWIASIDSFPQLAEMTLSTPGVWMGGYNVPGVSDAPPISIFGRPVYFTEKVPATGTSGGAAGDINFVDLSYYLIGDRQSVAVAASDQAFFQNDQTAYRIIERVDGRPWVQSPLTPHNAGATLSPYLGLSATHT